MSSQLGMKVMKSEVIGATCTDAELKAQTTTEAPLVGFYFSLLFDQVSVVFLCCFKINSGSIFQFQILFCFYLNFYTILFNCKELRQMIKYMNAKTCI